MSTIKDLLKQAKTELAREDYQSAIELSKKVLSLEKENYFAYVFLGKSYSCLPGKAKESIANYKLAIQYDSSNLLAWKGLFLLLKSLDVPEVLSYDDFFALCGEYADVLLEQQLSQVDLIHDIRLFRKKYPDCEESFLMHMVPGTKMAELLARHLISPQDALSKLINLVNKKEESKISKLVSRERLKLSVQDPSYQTKINALAWGIYEGSNLDQLYNQLINITDVDEARSDLETQWLEYRIKILKSMPKDIKVFFFKKVKSMVEDMVLVDHKSLMSWKLYFEWQDYEDLNTIDQEMVLKFFKKFPTEPLSVILYAWLSSDLSKYDFKKLASQMGQKAHLDEDNVVPDMDEIEQDALNDMTEKENENPTLLESDVITAMNDNISKAKNSILAHRIISQYFLLSREYEAAFPYVKHGISLVAISMRDLGADLQESKKTFTLDLAMIYTYIDAPKNHTAALSLFEKILADDPNNSHAKLGKGLIYMERNDWVKAHTLLVEVVSQFPNDMVVLSEFAWNQAQLGCLDDAIDIFTKVLGSIEGVDLRSCEFRALNLWRQAKVYLMKQEKEIPENQSYVKIAFKQLILSIRVLDTYAPSYSTLGDIYSAYYLDNLRAFKCYYKSFELDAADIVAAKFMASYYAEMCNWKAASLVAERLVKSEKAKRKLKEVNWAYKVVGMFYLESQQEADSIEWFQSSLRVNSKDIESWIGLGQAYYACGRIEASIKVFDRALELDPQHLYCLNLKAQSLSFMGEFEQCLKILREITTASPKEEFFQATFSEVLVKYAMDLYSQGLLTKAIVTAKKSIAVLSYMATELFCHGHKFWVSLSEALELFTLVQSKIDDLPIEDFVTIFRSASTIQETKELDELDNVTIEDLLSTDEDSNIEITCKLLVLSAKYSIATTNFDELTRTVRSSLWHNVGSAELHAYHIIKDVKYRKAAIECFKRSIHYQSNMCESWVGLGISTMDVSFKVAQHCFIKALTLNPKDVNIWLNLAMLGLKNGDLEFTQEVLTRSQSLAPQESSPWLVIALTYEKQGKLLESHRKFAHAFVLSNGRSRIAQLLYAKSILQQRIGKGGDERDLGLVEELTAAAYGLDEYFKKTPNDPFALQCALIILERLHNYSSAHKVASNLVQCLEVRFEKSQKNSELFNYAVVKSQLGRIQLGLGNYTSAIEGAELSQSILLDFSSESANSSRISNNLVLSLAYFHLNDFDKTLEFLEELLKTSKNTRSLIILIAKILYTVGSEDAKEIALQELVEYISVNGPDLMVNLTIAAIDIIENRKDEMGAILKELRILPLEDLISDRHKDIPYLIEMIRMRLEMHNDINSTWQKSAFFFMNDCKVWKNIDSRIEARVSCEGQNKVTASQLSDSFCSLGNLKNIQRSIFLSPTNKGAISALRECF